MLRDDGRFCDGCSQKLPPSAKFGQQTMSPEEAREYGSTAAYNADGTVIDRSVSRLQNSTRGDTEGEMTEVLISP